VGLAFALAKALKSFEELAMRIVVSLLAPLLAVAAVLLPGSVAAQDLFSPQLKPGDPAPPVSVEKWVQGEPVTSFEKGKIYVMEFWATWCGPCIMGMPHLSELNKKYEGKVVISGILILEQPETETPDAYAKLATDFMQKHPGRITYRVGVDGPSNKMVKTWMAPAGQNGIPCTFVIDQAGKIAYIGHPKELDVILERLLAGKFDLETFNTETSVRDEQFNLRLREVSAAVDAKEFNKVAALIQQIGKDFPAYDSVTKPLQFIGIASGDPDRAAKLIQSAIDTKSALDIGVYADGLRMAPGLPKKLYELTAQGVIATADPSDPIAQLKAYFKASQMCEAVGNYAAALQMAEKSKELLISANAGGQAAQVLDNAIERLRKKGDDAGKTSQ